MNAHLIVSDRAPTELNYLRVGTSYEVVTPRGTATGEYLGVETTHDVWSVLIRHPHGIDSIRFSQIKSMTIAPV